jgi:hypothetical protein
MAVFTDLQIKQWFETGDFPTQQQFFNLIDSKVNVLDLPALLGLSIGVTNITGGADKNILFQQGTKVSQDNLFKYDYTNRRIGVNISAPLTGFHAFSTVGNADPNPLTFSYQRDAVPPNSNTTWFAHNALNSANVRIAAFAFAQQAAGQGTRFSVLVTNNSAVTPATEGMRLSQEKRLSVGTIISNGARVDIHSEGNLSTDLAFRVRNNANTNDDVRVNGTGQVLIGTFTGIPSPSAVVEIESVTRGFLFPRMTTAQRNAIVAPANGLFIWNTTTDELNVFKTSTGTWRRYNDLP